MFVVIGWEDYTIQRSLMINDDDFLVIIISHHNQHVEVFSDCIPHTIILAMLPVAPPWLII
jgi:hypothetical protein